MCLIFRLSNVVKVYSPEEATTLMVVPKKHHGSVLFCDVVKGDASGDGSVVSIGLKHTFYLLYGSVSRAYFFCKDIGELPEQKVCI